MKMKNTNNNNKIPMITFICKECDWVETVPVWELLSRGRNTPGPMPWMKPEHILFCQDQSINVVAEWECKMVARSGGRKLVPDQLKYAKKKKSQQ